MKTKNLFFAALFFAALTLGFVGCENPDDNIDNDVEYRLEAFSNNEEMGIVEYESGIYRKGTEVTIIAVPFDSYHLCTWSDCDTKDLIRKIVINSDTVITAIFSDNPYLSVKSNNKSYGTVSGSGTYEIGSEVIITAKPEENYYFLSWSDCDSKELTRTVVVNTDSTIIANFAKKPNLVAQPNNANYGTVTGSGCYEVGTKVTITAATKGEHCHFNGWSDCNSKELTREVVITSDTTITAMFTADPYLNVQSNNTHGTVSGSGYYKSGTEVTITATPEPYRFFKSWSDTDTKDLTRTITVTSDTTIIANFAAKHLLSMGVVTGDDFGLHKSAGVAEMKDVAGDYLTGDEVVLELTIPLGFSFDHWELRKGQTFVGKKVVYDNPATIVVDDDRTINAYIKFAYADSVSGSENGHKYVDLGLPSGLKWATCNVGAFHSKDKGYLFAWGEVEPKMTYDWSTYKWCNGSSTTMTKYCTDSDYGTVDNKTVLDSEDDAAAVNMGGSWRMPTDDEIQELIDNCTWVTISNSYYASIGVSKINGNIIVFPKDGIASAWDITSYWSSSLSPNTYTAKCGSMREFSIKNGYRYGEMFVRGVTE